MDNIKTYRQVNKQDSNISFGISRMEQIYDRRKGEVDHPHRHDYYTIVMTKEADGQHFIDFCAYPLRGQQVYFISPGQVHQVVEKIRSTGFAIVFSAEFLVKNSIPARFIHDLNLFHDFGKTPPLDLNGEELEQLTVYADEMFRLYHSESAFKMEAIGALLKLYLIKCNNLCSLPAEHVDDADRAEQLLKAFKSLIGEHYHEWHYTSEYAAALAITPDHLNRVVRQLTGKTAKQHIQSMIIVAAKRLLYFSGLSVKEIGFRLGFSEPANFSAFFKKCTGSSPSKFMEAA